MRTACHLAGCAVACGDSTSLPEVLVERGCRRGPCRQRARLGALPFALVKRYLRYWLFAEAPMFS